MKKSNSEVNIKCFVSKRQKTIGNGMKLLLASASSDPIGARPKSPFRSVSRIQTLPLMLTVNINLTFPKSFPVSKPILILNQAAKSKTMTLLDLLKFICEQVILKASLSTNKIIVKAIKQLPSSIWVRL